MTIWMNLKQKKKKQTRKARAELLLGCQNPYGFRHHMKFTNNLWQQAYRWSGILNYDCHREVCVIIIAFNFTSLIYRLSANFYFVNKCEFHTHIYQNYRKVRQLPNINEDFQWCSEHFQRFPNLQFGTPNFSFILPRSRIFWHYYQGEVLWDWALNK